MNTDRFAPLIGWLRSPVTIVLALAAAGLWLDLTLGSPLAASLVNLQMKLMHIDPQTQGVRLVTIFGTFRSVDALAAVMDTAVALLCLAVLGISCLRAALGVIFHK